MAWTEGEEAASIIRAAGPTILVLRPIQHERGPVSLRRLEVSGWEFERLWGGLLSAENGWL